MTERTVGREAAIGLINEFREATREINPGALEYLLGMRALELGVRSLEFPPGDKPLIPDGLVPIQRSAFSGAGRTHISGWSPELRADADKVLGLLAEVYPNPDKTDGN